MKLIKGFLVAFIGFLPFQNLILTVLDGRIGSGSAFWIAHWYEPILLVLFLYALTVYVRCKKIDKFLIPYFALAVLSIFSIFILSPTFSRGVEGFRFTLMPLMAFFVAYVLTVKDDWKILIKIYLVLAVIVAAWGLAEYLFLPAFYWSKLGIVPESVHFGFGWHMVGSNVQVTSLLGGANQTASYLLPAFFILFLTLVDNIRERARHYVPPTLLLIILASAIFLTFSRSALVGLIFAAALGLILYAKNNIFRLVFLGLALVAIILAIVYRGSAVFTSDFITHGQSQTQHISAMKDTFIEIDRRVQENPLEAVVGSGLGTAGPIALKYGSGLISESWYLQLILELGFLGLLLWIAFIFCVILRLFKVGRVVDGGLALGIIAVSVTSIFLHSWADNPAMAFTVLILMGTLYEKNID